jgi:hypothetical protein
VLYVDFKLDESYTPSKISIRAGDGFHNLKVTLFAARNGLFRRLVLDRRIYTCSMSNLQHTSAVPSESTHLSLNYKL